MAGKKRKSGKKSKKQVQHGEGPIWDGIKNVAGKANDFLKNTKILSTVTGLIPPSVPYVGKIATVASPVLKTLGYGNMANGIKGAGPSGNPKYAKRINV